MKETGVSDMVLLPMERRRRVAPVIPNLGVRFSL